MQVIACRVGKAPELIELANELKSMQQFVGGYIEAVPIYNSELILICNEEGKFNATKVNYILQMDKIRHDAIFGDFLICKAKGDEFTGVDDWHEWQDLICKGILKRCHQRKEETP